MARARSLGEAYRSDGALAAAESAPLHARMAVALGESAEAMRALGTAPPRVRQPARILAALHDLALAGRAPALAAALAAEDVEAAAGVAVDTLLEVTEAVVALAGRRAVRSDEAGRAQVLYPLVAEAAHRAGAAAIGMISVRCGAGLDLLADRVGITYSTGQLLGDPSSPVQLTASIVGDRPVPHLAMPEVVARIGVDRAPVDIADPDAARWLRACVWPDQRERAARLDAELALAASAPPLLLRGDPIEVLPAALAAVPAEALPVVTTTWALSQVPVPRRLRFLQQLEDAGRSVAWVSVEGVGVAPSVPTFGDRPASGHSILGIALVDGRTRVDAVGRCWSRGRLLSWLAGS